MRVVEIGISLVPKYSILREGIRHLQLSDVNERMSLAATRLLVAKVFAIEKCSNN